MATASSVSIDDTNANNKLTLDLISFVPEHSDWILILPSFWTVTFNILNELL
nr:MAG TPA: hypothetical protein [Bacteriophage sp.]